MLHKKIYLYYNYIMLNLKKSLIITLFIIFSINFTFSVEVNPSEIADIIKNIQFRISILTENNPDKIIEEKLLKLKSKIDIYVSFNKKIITNDKEIIILIKDLEDKIKDIKLYNDDKELKLMLIYLKMRLITKEDQTETTDLDQETKKILEIIINDLDVDKIIKQMEEKGEGKYNVKDNSDDNTILVKYLLIKIYELENKISTLKNENNSEKDTELEEKIKKLDEMEKNIEKIIKEKTEEEMVNILNELKVEDEKLQEKIDKIIEQRKKDKKVMLNPVNKYQWGKQFSFQLGLGLSGIYTVITAGIMFPKIKNLCTMGLLFNFGISTPGSYVAENFRTSLIAGSYYISFSSPVFTTYIRIYGGLEFYLGYIFSSNQISLFGSNITFGGYALGGMEFYFIKQIAFFIEAGVGLLYTYSLDPDPNWIRENALSKNNNNGTGIRLNFGIRIYTARNEKLK